MVSRNSDKSSQSEHRQEIDADTSNPLEPEILQEALAAKARIRSRIQEVAARMTRKTEAIVADGDESSSSAEPETPLVLSGRS